MILGDSEHSACKSQSSVLPGTRLCYVVTHPISTCFLRGQLRHMHNQGYQVTLITSPGRELDGIREVEKVCIQTVPMEREIRPIRDLWALIQLYRVIRLVRPQIVNAGTPKAGLLGMLAAWAARVPVRIYTLHGLRLETTTGLKRRILTLAERISSACAKRVVCVSRSLANQYVQLCRVDSRKVTVLGSGSCNGVDTTLLARTHARVSHADRIRTELGISPGEPVIGYVGRLSRDKGIADLVQAFHQVRHRMPSAALLLVGDLDATDMPDDTTLARICNHPRIFSTGFVDDVAPYLHAMNVFAFPSYREGFGNAALEAQAAGLPVVGYRATGVVDAVSDGVTGQLIPVGAVDKLAAALISYVNNPELAAAHGTCGAQRARDEFSQQGVWARLGYEYSRLFQMNHTQLRSNHRLLKRMLDIGVAALALIVFFPLLLATALLVRWRLGRPSLFWQQRPGLHAKLFWMPKFRTMKDERDSEGEPLPDEMRMTPLGRFLRSTSLDELPELWSVLRGEMSLVGPRPLLKEYLDHYTPDQARRHDVKPGITGWAQVNGRNGLSWDERFRLDIWYVDNQSLWLDLKIIVLTVFAVMTRRGISAADHVTMPRFDETLSRGGPYGKAA